VSTLFPTKNVYLELEGLHKESNFQVLLRSNLTDKFCIHMHSTLPVSVLVENYLCGTVNNFLANKNCLDQKSSRSRNLR